MRVIGRLAALATALAATAPGQAYLYWTRPAVNTAPVTGDEPGIAIDLPKATPKEKLANVLWATRAGLNVAALQCQFAPILSTVKNYNALLHQHGDELKATQATLLAYFKRTSGKTWQTAFDQYTTRTYNGFSTLHGQLSFCDTAGEVGRDALSRKIGAFNMTATNRLRELRTSLLPVGDSGLVYSVDTSWIPILSNVVPTCYDKKGREKVCKPEKNKS